MGYGKGRNEWGVGRGEVEGGEVKEGERGRRGEICLLLIFLLATPLIAS